MRSVFLVLMLALGLAACSDTAPKQEAAVLGVSSADAAAAARMISQYRAANGLSPVTVSAKLNEVAAAKARSVAAAGKLSHTNPEFSGRMHKHQVHGAAAENLSANADTVAEALARWKKSSGHNENLLMPEARQIGLAQATTASGYRTYWVLILAADQSDPNNGAFGW